MEKRKRRTKAEVEASKGLGDTVEKVLQKTGVAKVAKWLLGEDCGCDERKAKLNEWFPYATPNCLTEDEHNYLTNWFSEKRNSITPVEQRELLAIYNRVFNKRQDLTTCSTCWKDILKGLQTVFDSYE